MSPRPKILCELEVFLKDKFPKIIYKLLCDCGFDNKTSIRLINGQTVKLLESYVNKNRNILKNSTYDRNKEFEFSIGHKLLILNLPSYLNQLEKTKIENKQNNSLNNEQECKKAIVNKLQNYVQKYHFNVIVSEENIINFQKTSSCGYKCHVKCAICENLCSCLYKKNWNTSNFTNHLKLHFPLVLNQKEEIVFVAVAEENSIEKAASNVNQSIQRINNSDLKDLLNVCIQLSMLKKKLVSFS